MTVGKELSMREKKLVLFYPEAEFVTRFAAYLEKKSALPVRCRVFTDYAAFRDYLRDEPADLILLPGNGSRQNL